MYRKITKEFLPRLAVGTRIIKYPVSNQCKEVLDLTDTTEIADLLVVHITGPGYRLYTGAPENTEQMEHCKETIHKSVDELVLEGRYWIKADAYR